MMFQSENRIFLKTFVTNDLSLKLRNNQIEDILQHPIIKYCTKDHSLNLCVLVRTDRQTEELLFDVVGMVLVRMCWPKPESTKEFAAVFNTLINLNGRAGLGLEQTKN